MSDWQFASKEGLLRWTSPALPDRGQLLYSVLSPTLLLGYHQQGDLLPVDYLKLAAVRRVERSGPEGIELERDGGMVLLIVAESSAAAGEWLAMINLAMQGQEPQQNSRSVSQQQQQPNSVDGRPAPVESRVQGQVPQPTAPRLNLLAAQSAPSRDDACPNDDTGSGLHQFRPVSEVLGGGATTYGAFGNAQATTTTYTTQTQVRPSGGIRPLPATYETDAPDISGVYADGLASARLRMSRPLDSQGQFTPSGPALMSVPAMGGRPRSGMMVQLPATQQVNRNIAPNLSAMWKEWQGPDGATYLLFEPTGTMLRRLPDSQDFEMFVEGTEELTEEQLAAHPYSEGATTVNMNAQAVRNLQAYGRLDAARLAANQSREITASSVYRSEVVKSPRGQYSPSRHAALEPLASPRIDQHAYTGKRVHRVTLGVNKDEPNRSVLQHEVETLGGSGLLWDPQSNQVTYADGSRSMGPGGPAIGNATLHRQWEEVRQILMRGRYFKKHALRTDTSQFRMVFLTSDNAYVCAVPTSAVLQNATRDPTTFGNVTETVQYYGPDTRAIPLNSVQRVSLGTDEDFVYRRRGVIPEATFCIVSKTHAFVLECRNKAEAEFYADAWNFFLFHSKPVNPGKHRTPQMVAPVTHGTRTGIRF